MTDSFPGGHLDGTNPIDGGRAGNFDIDNAWSLIDGTGGTLWVATELTDYDVVIRVEDSGKGMSPETMAQMHQAWFTTRKNGTGLGMLIVRRIVREHGGELSVQSGEGKGTTVIIALPRQNRAARFLESGENDTPRRKPGQVIDV